MRAMIMMPYVVLIILVGVVHADYDCLCNYNVETSVYLSPSNQGQPIGYLYEFDCKQIIEGRTSDPGWATIAFEHKIGYIVKDSQTNAQICPGEPPAVDVVTTTSTTATTETTTFINTISTTGKPVETSLTTTRPSTTTNLSTTSSTSIPTTSTTRTSTTTSTTTPTTTLTTASSTTPTTTASTTTSTTTPTTTSTTKEHTSTSQTTRSPANTTTTRTTTSSATVSTIDTSTTSSSGKLVCPLSLQQIAQAEQSQVFVNENNGKCYELATFKRAWRYAEDDCKSKGGHLTSIENLNEDRWLYGHIKLYGDDTWIGLNDKASEEHYEWTSGDTAAYTNWVSGHRDPSSHGTDDCVLMKATTGYWNDVGCGSLHAYICKFDAVIDNGTHISLLPTRTHTTPSTQTSKPTSTTTADGKLSCPTDILQTAQSHGWSTFVSEDTRKCYELVEQRRTWDNAENDCQRKGGHLATIKSQSVENVLYRYVKVYGHATWIGLHDQNREEHFEWSSGDPVTYLNWHPGRKDPLFHRFEDCVTMGSLTGTWEDMDCLYNNYAYICEFDAVLGGQGPITSVDGDINLCPSTVRHLAERDNAIIGQYERGCYELMRSVKVSWQHGEDLCQSRGGHLAHISNAQQQSFIQTFLNRHSPQHAVWIGLHDTNIEGVFQWTSGSAVAYTNWIPGHVSNFESFHTEDCVAFIPYKNGKWDDIPCGNEFDLGETHPILCQYKIPLSPGIVG